MDVRYYRTRRLGPEAAIESAVANRIPDLFPNGDQPMWTAGSFPVGAGKPDLIAVSWEPRVVALAQVSMLGVHILAYLRSVRQARLGTIANRLGRSRESVQNCLNVLHEAEAVSSGATTFSLSPPWGEILREIVAVEAKVANWRRAVEQAARNRVFTHRTFVAVPERIAQRIRREPAFSQLGVGIISVSENDEVRIVRRGRRRQPRVWTYYYKLALHVARSFSGAT